MAGLPIFLAGPTAVGKSAVALALAERINGEIISVDSMQVYRGLDIGTAKPSLAERQRVPHHLIDVADLAEAFDAAKFVLLAQAAVTEINARQRVPIFCGGTGLYFKAYLEGLGDAPPSDEALRHKLEAVPMPELLAELQTHDPETFNQIDQQNPRRVIRAVEVIRLTGKPYSQLRAQWLARSEQARKAPGPCFGIQRSPEALRQRVNSRVDEMFQQGLVAETERLLGNGLEQNRTAMQAIGYRQIVEHLRGERNLPETIDVIKQRTWQFVRHQNTWFRRHFAQLKWLDADQSSVPELVGIIAAAR